MVRDVTGRGHNLRILADPQWVPVHGVFAECGNGVVETGEQCDDGSRANGDGCSRQCTVRRSNPAFVFATRARCNHRIRVRQVLYE